MECVCNRSLVIQEERLQPILPSICFSSTTGSARVLSRPLYLGTERVGRVDEAVFKLVEYRSANVVVFPIPAVIATLRSRISASCCCSSVSRIPLISRSAVSQCRKPVTADRMRTGGLETVADRQLWVGVDSRITCVARAGRSCAPTRRRRRSTVRPAAGQAVRRRPVSPRCRTVGPRRRSSGR